MEAKYILIKSFVLFTMNFPPYEEVIKWVAEHQHQCNYEHLKTKWEQFAKFYSTSDAWLWFYVDCGDEVREALTDYVTNVYAPKHVREAETLKELEK